MTVQQPRKHDKSEAKLKLSLSNCMDCGKKYGGSGWLDLTFSKDQWLLIHPADGGVLCANCIIGRASKLPHVISISGQIMFAADYGDAHKTPGAGLAELIKASQLTIQHFKRNQISGNFQGDDEHECWTALRNALGKVKERSHAE